MPNQTGNKNSSNKGFASTDKNSQRDAARKGGENAQTAQPGVAKGTGNERDSKISNDSTSGQNKK